MIALAKLGRVGSAQPDDCGPHQTRSQAPQRKREAALVLIVVKSATSDPGPCSSY
jgi:hypothetical protein